MNRFLLSVVLLCLMLRLPALAQESLPAGYDHRAVAMLAQVNGQNAQIEDKPQPAIKQIDLDYAVSSGSVERVRDALERGGNTVTTAQRKRMLTQAIDAGFPDIVGLLLDQGMSVNGGPDGYTPLMDAARAGHIPVMKLLLQRGANINAKFANGITALYYSASRLDCMEYLLAHGARARQTDFNYALIVAVKRRDQAGVGFLLNKGADPNARNNGLSCITGMTPAQIRAYRGPRILTEARQSLAAARYVHSASEIRADKQIIQLLQRAGAKE